MSKRYLDLSVIIPVYNNENFIGAAIESVLGQTVEPREVIVVDDGSTDGTTKELEKFKSREKVKILTLSHGGVSQARNKGVEISTGQWLGFLDADDIWLKNKVEKELGLIARYPQAGFFCCNYRLYNHQTKKILNRYQDFTNDSEIPLEEPWDAFRALIKKNFIGTTSVALIKREIFFEAGRFNRAYRVAQDYDLWLRCALISLFVFIPEILVEKGVHDSNVTKDLIRMGSNHEGVLMELRSKYKAQLYRDRLWEESSFALAQKRYELANLYYEAGRISNAFGYFFRGLFVCWTWKNLVAFFYFFSRKLVRFISFGLIRKRIPEAA